MVLYVNGPVQNGDWTLAERPGKGAGIQLAEALNALLGAASVPHLWNCVTLAGDVRHRQAVGRDGANRARREEAAVAAKYAPGMLPTAGVLTDFSPAVTSLALEVTETLLADGTLAIRRRPVLLCARCGHMAGAGAQRCRSCGHESFGRAVRALLVYEHAAHGPVLEAGDFHGAYARTPAHLLNIARNVPDELVLSRTRALGVPLGAFGLEEGLVLDPRAGLHVAVWAAVDGLGAQPVMTVTENAAANVAAYGAPFRRHRAMRLRYLLHGRIPYEAAASSRLYEAHRAEELRELFIGWFLPLCAARERAGVHLDRLPALLKFLRRADLARPGAPPGDLLENTRRRVAAGDMRWVMEAEALACVLAAHATTVGPAGPPRGEH
ncbi:hypothetical protein [Streptomyces yangpuensis]|uniref:hypothetical protein n=1 Tax=Streptomyces yangpuensis TaxID=1648182 RepID=UPI003656F8ED